MTHRQSDGCVDQQTVIAFLRQPTSYTALPKSVEVIETHGALVFLAGDEVFKIKRAVKFDYLDFSTLARRKKICEREFALNKTAAPTLYLGVVPITQDSDGNLSINGPGTPVEWAVHMRSFDQSNLYTSLACRHKIGRPEVVAIAAEVARYHKNAAADLNQSGASRLAAIVQELREAFDDLAGTIDPSQAASYLQAAVLQLTRVTPFLDDRARAGLVRRCHGDLHLGNIVQLKGKPVLFDALEFDETLATTDLLYEVAFLVMDLWHQGLRAEANLFLNRYLFETAEFDQLSGLCALPLFMAVRAAIRTMVAAQRSVQLDEPGSGNLSQVTHYLQDANRFLAPTSPRLIAVGGLSGSGKSTLAAEIAAHIGAEPGAIHVRSDLERKVLFGVGETDRLGDECYTADANEKVYRAVMDATTKVLEAGHSVIADAVFADRERRNQIELVAERLGVPFTGLWLGAPERELLTRVEARHGDASDATVDTVRAQLATPAKAVSWDQIDASGSALETVMSADLVLRRDGALRFDEEFAQAKAAG